MEAVVGVLGAITFIVLTVSGLIIVCFGMWIFITKIIMGRDW